MTAKADSKILILAQNRRAFRDYHVLERFEAGLALRGTEVKAARQGQIQLKDAYVEFRDGEAYLVRAHVSPYAHGNRQNHDPLRPRKLLLRKRELMRLYGRAQIKGLTIVPLRLYLVGRWIKVEIALVQGKKAYDKREAERIKEMDREMDQARKQGRW